MPTSSKTLPSFSEAVISETKRLTIPALEDKLLVPMRILDHGFLVPISYDGGDEDIERSARVSYQGGTRKVSERRGLIRYLVSHMHTTPLEHCTIRFHVKAPIFVARQWIRHRMSSTNEQSARYSILDNEFYLPAPEVLAAQSKNNKQGREGDAVPEDQAGYILKLLHDDAMRNYADYAYLLNDDGSGKPVREGDVMLARELARMNLTLNFYTQWYWKIDLHNLMHFLGLRMDAHAQYEIRVYANAIAEIVKAWCPMAYEAFEDYRLHAVNYSRQEQAVLLEMLHDMRSIGLLTSDIEKSMVKHKLSKREQDAFLKKVNRG